MEKFVNKQNTGGTAFKVSDCRIWAEIHYLDSPTDYREYLPAVEPRRRIGANGPWGPPDYSPGPRPGSSYFVLFLACMFLLALGLLLHLSGH